MCVRLAKPESEIHQPMLKLLRQPRIRGEPANEKRELLIISQEQCSRILKDTDRVGGKSLREVISDGVYRRLNRGFEELRNFCPVCEKVWVPVHQWYECVLTPSVPTSRL